MFYKKGKAVLALGMVVVMVVGLSSALSGCSSKKEVTMKLEVTASESALLDKIAEEKVNFSSELSAAKSKENFDEKSLQVVEVDKDGKVIAENVPYQFDKDADYNAASKASGTLVFLLSGETAKGATRYYQVKFNDPDYTAKAITPLVTVTEEKRTYPAQGEAAEYIADGFAIKAVDTTYFYEKNGGGFAHMLDKEGKDWITYTNVKGSAGTYRGIPNAVHPEDCFHPGRDTVNSSVVSQGPLKVTISSESKDGKWACTWEVYPAYAKMTMLKMDHPYWFLYEGTPFGKLDVDTGYFVRADGTKTMLNEYMDSNKLNVMLPDPQWVYFGDNDTKRVLYLVQHENDEAKDSYYTMEKNMTVFGFGRMNTKKFITTVPVHFTIGFAEDNTLENTKKVIDSAYKDCIVTVK